MTRPAPRAVFRMAQNPAVGVTLRELDDFVAQATAAGMSWDAPVMVRGTFWPNSFRAPGVPFRQLAVERHP